MGKIRVKTIGDETQEKLEQEKAQKRAEAKRALKMQENGESAEKEPAEEKPQQKQEKKKTVHSKKQERSKAYKTKAQVVDKTKKYKLSEALALVKELKRESFDETVELHVNTTDKGISGNITLPHGTGKQTKVVIANYSNDAKAVDELIKEIEAGKISFDVLIATPDTMPKLAKVARVLGPRGLMPNPKNGTVTPKPEEVAKKFEGGQITFKTESKFPLLHLAIGKASFTEKQLEENAKELIKAVAKKNIKAVTLKLTMSPGMKLDVSSL